MVRAIIKGQKTQTRRVIKKQPDPSLNPDEVKAAWDAGFIQIDCPYGEPGDKLWVRESFADTLGMGFDDRYYYAADTRPGSEGDLQRQVYGVKWKPSIHMPRAVSRITLEVIDARVERLQEITNQDILAEGVGHPIGTQLTHGSVTETWNRDREFRPLWDSLNAERGFGWEENPWVWVIEFKRLSP